MRGKARINRALGKRYKGGALAASEVQGVVRVREIKNDVFISYSSSNKDVADQICLNLESKSIKCWIAPRDIRAGDTYQEAIINAIDASSIMVFVFSSVSNDSPHVIRELNRAVSLRVTLIPFRIENVPLSKAMEYLIGVPHWMDAYEPPLEDHVDRLAASVKSILEGEGRG
ncbi:MAG TPA: toll/interleukin-1 receptor domain-containing protein [Methanocella sp.]|nr:toll/interleukin-1 receptor domain-containing protein [Methanocella sp.]